MTQAGTLLTFAKQQFMDFGIQFLHFGHRINVSMSS